MDICVQPPIDYKPLASVTDMLRCATASYKHRLKRGPYFPSPPKSTCDVGLAYTDSGPLVRSSVLGQQRGHL